MNYNIFADLLPESAALLVIGVISANIVGSIGYVIWLFLQKHTPRFCAMHGAAFLRLVLAGFIVPLVFPVIFLVPYRIIISRMESGNTDMAFSVPMKAGVLILAIAWLAAAVAVLTDRYKAYWKMRYLYITSSPVVDADILELVENYKEKLRIRKQITILYNDTIFSPAIVYYNGYQIFLPVYEMSDYELSIALLHELTHLKNGDIIEKNIAFFVNALYSFNPITTFLREDIDRWAEVNCDLSCCKEEQTGLTRKEYFHCIMGLKDRCNATVQPDVINCLFEDESMLQFRIDTAWKVRDVQNDRGGIMLGVFVFLSTCAMVLTIYLSYQVFAYGCVHTVDVSVEQDNNDDIGDTGDTDFKECSEEVFFAGAEVSYIEDDILDRMESTDFTLEPGEIKAVELPGECDETVVVIIYFAGESYQFGYLKREEQITYVDRFETATMIVETRDIQQGKMYIKNTGKQECSIEWIIYRQPAK